MKVSILMNFESLWISVVNVVMESLAAAACSVIVLSWSPLVLIAVFVRMLSSSFLYSSIWKSYIGQLSSFEGTICRTNLLVPFNLFSNELITLACRSRLEMYCCMIFRVSWRSIFVTRFPNSTISFLHDLPTSAFDFRIRCAFINFRLMCSRFWVSLNVTE